MDKGITPCERKPRSVPKNTTIHTPLQLSQWRLRFLLNDERSDIVSFRWENKVTLESLPALGIENTNSIKNNDESEKKESLNTDQFLLIQLYAHHGSTPSREQLKILENKRIFTRKISI